MRSSRLSVDLSSEPPSVWLGILVTVVVVAIGTGLIFPLKSVAPAVSLGVVYIPGVLLISTVWGWQISEERASRGTNAPGRGAPFSATG
jgi:hypothetical protein